MGESGAVYRGYSQAELDAQYDQRTLVPDLVPYMRHWLEASAAVRASLHCRLDVAYGPSEAERMDIFPASDNSGGLGTGRADAPVVINIHGGAWRLLGKEHAAFPAPQVVAAGACFVALGFASVDDAPLDEIVRQVRTAAAWLHRHAGEFGGDGGRIHLCGHSSGAHLAAMVLADGWRAAAELPDRSIRGAVIVSGAYDLEPVRLSARNDYLRLDPASALRNSPIHHVPGGGPPLWIGWGDGELDEFRRQGAAFADAWRAAGNPCEALELARHNHFDMSSAFGDRTSPMIAALMRQLEAV